MPQPPPSGPGSVTELGSGSSGALCGIFSYGIITCPACASVPCTGQDTLLGDPPGLPLLPFVLPALAS